MDNHAETDAADERVRGMLERRQSIGEAKGMLMERYGLTSDAAFALLARVSQSTNRKVHDLARDFLRDRQLPEPFEYVHDLEDEPAEHIEPKLMSDRDKVDHEHEARADDEDGRGE